MAYQMKSREKLRWGKERRREKKKKEKWEAKKDVRVKGKRGRKKKKGRQKSSLGQCVGPIKRLKYLSDEN